MAIQPHFRILTNFVVKFAVLAIPAVGIVLADSLLWELVWWGVYIAWGSFLARYEVLSKTVIGTMWAQAPFVLLLDFRVTETGAWLAAGLWGGLSYWYIYRQALLLKPLD